MSHWVDTAPQLDAISSHAASAPLAVDTEFIRERTYYPKLALVQIGTAQQEEYLIDPVALPEPAALAPLLTGGAPKIMHSPSEDLQAFARGWNLVISPIFDTQLAAALVGLGAGKSYQALVDTLLGTPLEKGETRSDWLQRPLTTSQQHYAAEDVRHLHALHAILDAKLEVLGRRHWLEQDCARLVETACDDSLPENPHLEVRSAQHMNRDAQARMRRLMRWREGTARQRDLPRSWILDNELLVLLTQHPLSRSAFEDLLDRHPRAPRRSRSSVWEEVSRPLSEAERDIPLACAPDPVQRPVLKAMQAEVARIASELDIPEGLLCARRHLESLLTHRQWPAALNGWRHDLLHDALMQKLA